MPSFRLAARAALLASVCLLAGPASAQVAPRMMIAVDTSGSMAADLNNVPTFGDGVLTGCTEMAGGHYCGTNCMAGIDTDCDGEPNDSRMYVASEAIRNMLLAYGEDVDWAMSRFDADQTLNGACNVVDVQPGPAVELASRSIQTVECGTIPSLTSFGNPQCNTGTARDQCGNLGGGQWLVDTSDYDVACRPGSGSNPSLRNLDVIEAWTNSDGNPRTNPFVCLNYPPGDCDGTSNSGQVIVGFRDYGPWAGRSNLLGLLRWVDHRDSAFRTTTTVGNVCDHVGTGDCELRALGRTPLAGILRASSSYMTAARSADSAAACRPYSVILLTDGQESCACPNGTPPEDCAVPITAATELATNDITTYVIGLNIAGAGARFQLNAIATAGGTDAGAPGGDTAFFADDPATLSAALASIIADSVLVEVCNGADDDCDALVDEGVANACGGCGAVPAETCNGADQDCDGRVDEGVSNACGGCGAVPAETCNRLDDDCDGRIDEDGSGGDLCAGCSPRAEICDDVDNDCDSRIDEGVTRSCGTDVGACQAGTQTCNLGTTPGWGACVGQITGGPESCNGVDDDCDGVVDGMTRPCGTDVGQCVAGTQVCIGTPPDTWGACVGAIGSGTEVCDGEDDDCDGDTDEDVASGGACGTGLGLCEPGTLQCMGGALTCVGGVGPEPFETCDGQDEDCDGSVDEGVPNMGACGPTGGECRQGVMQCTGGSFQCVGARGPTDEVCDGLNNDCDASTDEGNPGAGTPCGTDTGECVRGANQCTGGSLVCVGAMGPRTEVCDGVRDEDCDGLVDEANPGGGARCGTSDVGLCERGTITCVSGALICVGEVGSIDERCDGADNDCDGMIDEDDPEGGGACGDATGACTAGTFACVDGMLVCEGGALPGAEVCNGIDDDCDGVVDDGIPITPCGSDVGECVAGSLICREGAPVCVGAIEEEAEACDDLDNDCDGTVDEDLGVGDACGSDEGLCMPGVQRCTGGRIVCDGEVGPRRDGCDCADNDCDGAIDEAPETGSLCPGGSECVQCQCALPCTESEFGFSCPTGKTPRVDGAQCFCVEPLCDEAACATQTVERDGETLCGPDRADVASCVCSNNTCTFACEGVSCLGGTVCDPRDPLGRCVENNCRGLGCPSGEVCDVDTGLCAADACEGVSCGATEACRAGDCEPTCASVTCGGGERCRSGVCETDPCGSVVCGGDLVCNPSSGTCVPDRCATLRCPVGEVCDLGAGECVADPCTTLRCPADTVCEAGECVSDEPVRVDAGVDAGGLDAGPPGDGRDRVITAGGCMCRVGAEPRREDGGAPWLLGLGVLGALALRRRRRARSGAPRGGLRRAALRLAAGLGAVAVSALGSGCEVEPFCLDCHEVVEDAGQDAGRDAGLLRRDAGPRDAGTDGGPDAGPCPEERCNELDDDCDGEVDEGIDTRTDLENCGACGALCAPTGAFGVCTDGECGIASCDVGRLDVDEDPANGCEYRCLVESDDDAACDLRDNDCDTRVDEDIDLEGDAVNCGACGVVCTFAHAAASCVDAGCVRGDCEPGFHDVDGSDANGCEYACTPADPATETCNGEDDDCDGDVDEGNPGGGGTCGLSAGECSPGTLACVGGTLVCDGGVEPTTEVCNGDDDDCDGDVDEGNPGGGRVCGTAEGTCEVGRETCEAGAVVCVGAVGPVSEICDGLDNDCDGVADDGNPGGGARCGTDEGECVRGTITCQAGALACVGATVEIDELCNGLDDDCDGDVDEDNPQGGASCGTDVGICSPGLQTCSGGTLRCVGATGPRAGGELCNGLDDDCDGTVDDGNPGGGVSCGTNTGECVAGTLNCAGGTLQCQGSPVGPSLETCDGQDDDCDTRTDEDFMPFTSLTHCGGCNTPCRLDNATETCASGTCVVVGCDAGFVDLDGLDATGCEYPCDFNGAEVCNGQDDDCDMDVDEGVVPPATFCNPNGVCGSTTPTCSAGAWICTYPGTYQETESRCDGLDNDCDGAVDEPFPSLGTACGNGTGGCRRTGTIVCTADQLGTRCNAAVAGTPAAFESCNNVDDDCDGPVDEAIPSSAIPTVQIPRAGGGTVRVMVYEASRPDADGVDAGQVETRACSNPGVLPWTDVTWTEARDACCALNPSGTCGATGWRLCDAPDWQSACEGPAASCDWSYETSCSSSAPLTCNGFEGADGLLESASTDYGMCFTDWAAAGVIYDLSGNVKEWTNTETIPGVHQIRGGAYNNVEDGRACTFDFTAGDLAFSFPHTGFRCCLY